MTKTFIWLTLLQYSPFCDGLEPKHNIFKVGLCVQIDAVSTQPYNFVVLTIPNSKLEILVIFNVLYLDTHDVLEPSSMLETALQSVVLCCTGVI